MKVVLDTNVVMSGIFWKGLPSKILELWSDKLFSLVMSEEIFSEYKEVVIVLQKRYKINRNIDALLNLIAVNAHFVHPHISNFPRCSDPDDDKFIALAVSSKAKYIVTGDRALLKVDSSWQTHSTFCNFQLFLTI